MSRYGRFQLDARVKPSTSPAEGFRELFSDSDNGGAISVLNSNGDVVDLEAAANEIGNIQAALNAIVTE